MGISVRSARNPWRTAIPRSSRKARIWLITLVRWQTTGDLVVNLDSRTVKVNGDSVHLTSKEYQILELLSLRKGTSVTKEMFLTNLYGGMHEPEIKIIDVFICKLRKKLASVSFGKNYIETVWGRGYVLRQPTGEEEMKISA
jgi:two-component system cell cycle response regulator CtrA